MVGTGPFTYGGGKGSSVTLQWNRRSNWWATKALGMKMPMQYVVDIHNSQNTASLQNFLKNDIDLSNNFFPGVDKVIGGKVQTYYPKAPYMLSANTAWLVPNTTHAPLNDVAFRQALAMSINIDQIVTADYGNIVKKASPTGLLPTWDKWIDKAQANKLGFKYNVAGAKALLAANGYKDTDGDGYVENKAGKDVNLRLIVPNGWSDWMTAIQIISASAKQAGIHITPAYPDYNGLVDERNSGKFDLVINNDKQLGPTPYTYYDYLFHLPIADSQTFANYSRFTAGRPEAVGADACAQQGQPGQRGGGEGASLEDPEGHPRAVACNPALVQRGVGAVQHDLLDELPEVHGRGPAEHARHVERIPQHDGHRRARQVEAGQVAHTARADSAGRTVPPLLGHRPARRRYESTHDLTPHGDLVTRYLARKSFLYLLTFFFAVTIDWAIPRLMPGDPIDGLIGRIQADSTASQELKGYFTESFGLDQPLWKQYLNFWRGLLHGDLGPSIAYVGSTVSELIWAAVPYTLALLVPAIVLSYIAGNRVGAMAARRKVLDNTVLPVAYILTATPYMWLALVLAYFLAFKWGLFPVSGAYDFSLQPAWSWEFARSFLSHWFLPFLTLFLVSFGGWAIGMRNLIIYELESEYANYLQALGAPNKLVRKYAYGNAVLPQMSGLALALGAVVGGALVTEIVFGYPGIGTLIITALQNRDYFLMQGLFLLIIIGVLIANFIVDIAYVIVDPRTRAGIQGS